MDPIGNKPFGFYGSSMVYTMSLFRRCEVELKFTVHYSLFGPNSEL